MSLADITKNINYISIITSFFIFILLSLSFSQLIFFLLLRSFYTITSPDAAINYNKKTSTN